MAACGKLSDMTDDLLAEQIAYYRSRAPEYDATAYPPTAGARIASIVAGLGIRGEVLELACGTGMWTPELARYATRVLAVDAAPEAVAIARRRCPPNVEFEVADLFTWQPACRFDTVFFSAWLSHVPTDRVPAFLAMLRDCLVPGGRVVFVDEPVHVAAKERRLEPEAVERTLNDGTRHRIVKVFLDHRETGLQLARLGWTSSLAIRDDWLIGIARPR